jgi:hypothetical protein
MATAIHVGWTRARTPARSIAAAPAVGEADAVELLSQWEGFARFCREALRVEPLVLLLALGLGHGDPAAEVRAAYPDAAVDEAEVARWSVQWARGWERRFAVRS